MKKENFIIEITKRDKVYLSIILCLISVIVCLAICLPRPYKVIEKEVVVYVPQEKRVFETKKEYIITSNSSLFDESINGYKDLNGNQYVLSSEHDVIDCGKLDELIVSVSKETSGVLEKKTIIVEDALAGLIVENSGAFGCKINVNQFIMLNIKNIFDTNLGANSILAKEDFLFEFKFEKAELNIIVSFISE